MPRKTGVQKIDFASAPRAVLAGKYVQAHIDKWNSYKKGMMIVGKVPSVPRGVWVSSGLGINVIWEEVDVDKWKTTCCWEHCCWEHFT